MTNSVDPHFERYCEALVGMGWPRAWVRNNAADLRRRFAQSPQPFAPPPPPPEPARDRYEEL